MSSDRVAGLDTMTTRRTTRPPRCPAARPSSTWPPGRPRATSCWSARRPTPARATRSPRPGAGCRWSSSTATVEVVGPDGPVPFLDLFQGRDELVVYQHMWYDGAPHQGQCEGCTTTAWHLKDAVYLNARGVSFAILTTGPWDEVAPYVEFMGYTQPWYSVRDVDAPVGGEMGHLVCFLRDGDRVFLTYSTTGRGNEPANGSLGLLDMTPYGRGEAWEDNPEGWPVIGDVREGTRPRAARPAGTGARTPTAFATWGPTSRPVPQWTRPGATPVETLGREGHHH